MLYASAAGENRGIELQREEVSASEQSKQSHAEDRRLVQGLLSKDTSVWHAFVTNYGRIVRSRVADVARSFGYTNDTLAIDDATADVFVALCANDLAALRAFAGRSALSTYLAVISTRCATRSFARKRQQKRVCMDANVSQVAASISGTDPARGMLLDEERSRVQRLLENLPEKQREVVNRFYLEGQSYATISLDLDIPIGSVGVTLQRAEAKLRKQVEPPQ